MASFSKEQAFCSWSVGSIQQICVTKKMQFRCTKLSNRMTGMVHVCIQGCHSMAVSLCSPLFTGDRVADWNHLKTYPLLKSHSAAFALFLISQDAPQFSPQPPTVRPCLVRSQVLNKTILGYRCAHQKSRFFSPVTDQLVWCLLEILYHV